MNVLIAPQTGAATIKISVPENRKVMVSSGKLVSAEVVTFQLDESEVATLGDLYQGGSIRQLTATDNCRLIEGPIDLQVSKGATAASTGVYVKGGFTVIT